MSFHNQFLELKAPDRGWKRWHTILLLFFILCLTSVGGFLGTIWYFSQDLPDITAIDEHRPSLVTQVYSDDKEVIGQYYLERRFLTPLEEMPRTFVNAVIAVEDARFFEHPGLDVKGIIRAFWTNLRRGGKVEGASTITQQLARSLFLSTERTYTRKIRELILAFKIEKRLSKEKILEMYLNQIYFGHGAYGIRAAAHTFFEKPLSDLTLEESAVLAGLPKSPNNYSPFRNPELAKKRQVHVLARMEEAGFISAAEHRIAVDAPLQYRRPETEKIAPYFLESLRQYLVAKHGESEVYKGGLKVYTTLNVPLQYAAEAAVRQGLRALDKRQGWRGPKKRMTPEELNSLIEAVKESTVDLPKEEEIVEGVVTKVRKRGLDVLVGSTVGSLAYEDMEWARRRLKGPDPREDAVMLPKIKGQVKKGDVLEVALKQVDGKKVHWVLEQTPIVEGALIAIDPRTGGIRAMVGGYDFVRSEYNRALIAHRQPGSAFKPIIYATAINKGMGPGSLVLDAPVVYEEEETERIWKPENYEQRFYGVISLREALIHSRNLATVRLLDQIGFKPVEELSRALGINSSMSRDLSLALGSSSMTLVELTSAYGVFANQGIRNKPYMLTAVHDQNGETLEQMLFEPEQVLTKETSYLVTNMLEDVVQHGTGQRAKVLKRSLAGKTGTTNDYTDGWFIGYTPNLALGVWVGFDDRRPLGDRESGAHSALPIWIAFMKEALEQIPMMPFEIPDDVVYVRVDPTTGLLPADGGHSGTVEIFAKGTEPKETAPQRVDPTEFYQLDTYQEIPDSTLSLPTSQPDLFGDF